MPATADLYYKKDFWAEENLKYAAPHFRLEKAARLINKLAGKKQCDLLDLGCGPAALMQRVRSNISYYGIDIAIKHPGPRFLELDFVESPIKFGDRQFDFVVAQGLFEYIGGAQEEKLSEIRQLLKEDGKFIVTYVNFDHCRKNIYWPYNNIRSFDNFRASVSRFFRIQRFFPTSHRWTHDEPKGRLAKAIQSRINANIPFVSRRLAVEYFFICSH